MGKGRTKVGKVLEYCKGLSRRIESLGWHAVLLFGREECFPLQKKFYFPLDESKARRLRMIFLPLFDKVHELFARFGLLEKSRKIGGCG